MNKNYEFYQTLIECDKLENSLWDLVVITAISSQQKQCYEKQIQSKLKSKKLPVHFNFLVLSDPDDAKIGSGGSTLYVLKRLHDIYKNDLLTMKILLIHAGGYSQRQPTCTILGKIFSPVACESSYINDMLDLKLAIYSPFSVHMKPGVFLTSSDDFESFEFDEQVELGKQFGTADFVLIAHKSPLTVGKDHGVYALDESKSTLIHQCKFVLQKPAVQKMRDLNVVIEDDDNNEFVYTDSVFYFGHSLTPKLIQFHGEYFDYIVANKIEIDAYRDFLQPLGSTPMEISAFLSSAGVQLENKPRVDLFTRVYELFLGLNVIVVAPSGSDFFHLGTVNELLDFYLNEESSESVKFRRSLCFAKQIPKRVGGDASGCVLYSKLGAKCELSELSLVEYCCFDDGTRLKVNDFCFINNCSVKSEELDVSSLNLEVPANVCMHTIPIRVNSEIRYATIFFNRNDDLKKSYNSISDIKLLGMSLPNELCGLKLTHLNNNSIWSLKVFKYYETMSESFVNSLGFVNGYLKGNKLSSESLNEAVSLFDILKLQSFEHIISFRLDNGLLS